MTSMTRTIGRKMGREQNRELRNLVSSMRVERMIKEVDEARAETEKVKAQTLLETSVLRSATRIAAAVAVGAAVLLVGCVLTFVLVVL